MTAEDRSLETRQRLWRHLTTTMLGLATAIVFAGLSAWAVSVLGVEGSTKRIVVGLTVAASIVGAIGVGWWSAFRNLRCPGCGAQIWWQATWNMSLFARRVSKHCNSCGVRLFDARTDRFVLVLMVVAVVLGMVGAFVNVATRH